MARQRRSPAMMWKSVPSFSGDRRTRMGWSMPSVAMLSANSCSAAASKCLRGFSGLGLTRLCAHVHSAGAAAAGGGASPTSSPTVTSSATAMRNKVSVLTVPFLLRMCVSRPLPRFAARSSARPDIPRASSRASMRSITRVSVVMTHPLGQAVFGVAEAADDVGGQRQALGQREPRRRRKHKDEAGAVGEAHPGRCGRS